MDKHLVEMAETFICCKLRQQTHTHTHTHTHSWHPLQVDVAARPVRREKLVASMAVRKHTVEL